MNPCRRLARTGYYELCLEEVEEYMRRSEIMIVEYWDVVKEMMIHSGDI